MNILIMNQSVIDMCASFLTLLDTVIEVDFTRMSPDSIYDQFVCRFWMGNCLLWFFMNASTYGILLTTLDRYIAVIHPIWYNNNVRIVAIYTVSQKRTPVTNCYDLSVIVRFLPRDARSAKRGIAILSTVVVVVGAVGAVV